VNQGNAGARPVRWTTLVTPSTAGRSLRTYESTDRVPHDGASKRRARADTYMDALSWIMSARPLGREQEGQPRDEAARRDLQRRSLEIESRLGRFGSKKTTALFGKVTRAFRDRHEIDSRDVIEMARMMDQEVDPTRHGRWRMRSPKRWRR